jgi:PAS domain S-box-containing protein
MNYFAFLSLISCIILFALGIFVYCRNMKNLLNRIFLLLCIAGSYWAFSEFMLRQSDSFASAFFWLKLTAFWTFVPALLFHFIIIFTRSVKWQKDWWIYPLLYAPAVVFCYLELTTSLITVVPKIEYWGYTYGYPDNPWLFFIEIVWTFGLIFSSLALCLNYYFRSTGKREKQQAKYLVIGFGIPALAGFITQAVFPVLQIRIPEMTTIFFLWISTFIGYAIWRYELFIISPETAADNIISTMPDSLILLDAEEQIVVMNKATRDLLGYDDELIGSPIRMLFYEDAEKNTIFETITRKGLVSDYETTYRAKDGSIIPVSFSGSVIKDNDGNTVGIVCDARDSTERKKAQEEMLIKNRELQSAYENITAIEEELRQNYDDLSKTERELRSSEERYRLLFSRSPIGIVQIDSRGMILTVNQAFAEIMGVPPEHLVAFDTLTRIPDPAFVAAIKEALAGKTGYFEGEYTSILGNKRSFIRMIAQPLGTGGDKITGAIGIFEDITDRKRTEAALNRATRKLNLLTFITVTDIQNAIFTLSGYLELAKSPMTPEKLKDNLEKQRSIVHQIENRIKFARNYQSLGLKPARWQNVTQAFLYAISHLDLSTLSRTLDIEGLEIYADPLLENVFLSLSENILLHGKTATEIALWYRETEEGLMLVFEDNGAGIPDALKEKIFERRYEKKQGMGLYLVREILEITGITIRETGEPGKGARFEISVPKGVYRFTEGK